MYTNSSRSYLKMASGTPRRTNGTPWRTGGTPTAEYSAPEKQEFLFSQLSNQSLLIPTGIKRMQTNILFTKKLFKRISVCVFKTSVSLWLVKDLINGIIGKQIGLIDITPDHFYRTMTGLLHNEPFFHPLKCRIRSKSMAKTMSTIHFRI